MARKRFTGPKRKIEKVISRGEMAVTNALAVVNLRSVVDPETLVRIVGNFMYVNSIDALVRLRAQIVVRPAGVDIAPIGAAGGADVRVGKAAQVVVWHGDYILETHDAGADADYLYIPIDVKSQRKLDEEDLIQLQVISDNVAATQWEYSITQFYKQV